MGVDGDSKSEVLKAFRGEPSEAEGVTFLTQAVLEGLAGRQVPDGDVSLLVAAATLDLDFAFVSSWTPDAISQLHILAEDGRVPMWVVEGPFGIVAETEGWTKTLTEVAQDPRRLDATLHAAAEQTAAEVRRGLQAGADIVVIAEDLAGGAGPFMAPEDFRTLILPHMDVLVSEVRREGSHVLLHSDGDVGPLLRDIAGAGFTGVHIGGLGFERFEELFTEARGAGLAVVGGLEGVDLRSPRKHMEAAVRRCAALRAEGGLLIADDGGLSTAEEGRALGAAFEMRRATG